MTQTQSTSFKILKAELEHLDWVAPLFDDYRVFYKLPSDTAQARDYLRTRMQNEESVIYLAVAEGDEGWVGLGFAQLYPLFSSISLKRIWVLYDLFVDPRARRQGVGEALLERVKQLALETGAAEIMLQTATDNHPAQTLYEKMGFERDEKFYVYYLTC